MSVKAFRYYCVRTLTEKTSQCKGGPGGFLFKDLVLVLSLSSYRRPEVGRIDHVLYHMISHNDGRSVLFLLAVCYYRVMGLFKVDFETISLAVPVCIAKTLLKARSAKGKKQNVVGKL